MRTNENTIESLKALMKRAAENKENIDTQEKIKLHKEFGIKIINLIFEENKGFKLNFNEINQILALIIALNIRTQFEPEIMRLISAAEVAQRIVDIVTE